MSNYRTTPEETDRMPKGVPYIIGNEFAERYSFYGMKALLAVFLTKHLVDGSGQPDLMTDAEATKWIHSFNTAVYATPLLGGLIADFWLGKYRTIIFLSIVYCLGHFFLAMDSTRWGMMCGLGMIAVGAGGIKPCVSSHVGDQFGQRNAALLPQIFSWFYAAINIGAFLSMLIGPLLLSRFGPEVAFGVPGVLMVLATILFWLGRKTFAHIPARPKNILEELSQPSTWKTFLRLGVLYLFVAMFWALFDQTSSRWVLQAENMNLQIGGLTLLPSQLQSINPLLVVLLIPLFQFVIYPSIGKFMKVTPMRKVAVGMFLAVLAFIVPAFVENWIADGRTPSIGWQALAYLLLTAAEVMISITCLEYSYSQAPKSLKSIIMGLFLMSVALGNAFTAIVNKVIQDSDGESLLAGADYYWFFVKCMLGTAIVFAVVSRFFKDRTILQDDEATERA